MGRGSGGYRAGMRIGAGLAAPAFVLAVTFGSVAVDSGWGPAAPVVASIAVFSGSAQFTLVTALAGGTAWAAVVSAVLINLRFLPMALAVAPSLRGGRLRRALEGQAVVDGSWVAAHRGEGRFDRELLIGATLVQWPAWVLGTALGVALSPPSDLSHTLALDVVFPAFFVVLLLEELRASTRARVAGVLGGVLTAALLLVLPSGPALLGGSVAALLGLFGQRRQEEAP
jgi:predicted branched-subunit amino acid permease